jgi:TldD protein
MLIKQVEENLLRSNVINTDFLIAQTLKLVKRNVDFADLYLQLTTTESFALDEGIIKSGSFAINQGIGVRAICYDKTFLNHSSSISEKSINALVDNIFIQESDTKTNFTNSSQIAKRESLYTYNNPILSLANSEKISLLQKINELGRNKAFVTNVIASLSIEYDEIAVFNTNHIVNSDIRPLVHLSISVVINKNGKIEKGGSGCGGRCLLDMYTDELINFHVNKAYDQAILKTEAQNCPNGEMPVVLGNGWAGVILHEAVGHGLESDFNRKESSAFSNKIGQKVASELVTVIDDGTIANRRGSLNIDDEGNETQKTILIENGILRGYMFDELNARLMGTNSTGNGRRESFACVPMPRMTNTYMLNGNNTHDDIIASVEDGLYAENFEGGQVDITSGQFVFNASTAWVIKNGKLDHPVKGCALVGNGPECLKHVSMVGNNMALDSGIGVCGKSGQSVPVGVGQPTIKIDKSLIVGGS